MRQMLTIIKGGLDTTRLAEFEEIPNPIWVDHVGYLNDFLEFMDGLGLVVTDSELVTEYIEEWLTTVNPPKV